MEVKLRKMAFGLILGFALTSCDKFEMRGFVMSYESANQRFEQSMAWNFLHPYKTIVVPDEEYTLFVMGDSHVGHTENLDHFIEEASDTDADAIVMVGDITTGHEKDYRTFFQHIPDHDTLLTFPVVGNHDLYFDGWTHFYELFGSTTYYFTIETPNATDLFICIDTGGGTLGSSQLDWLKDLLEIERSKYRRCVIFTHNNLFRIRHTTSTNPNVEELHVLIELCVKHQIDVVVTGHDHKRNVVQLGNTVHITLDALEDASKNAGYCILSNYQGEIQYEFIEIDQFEN